MPRVTDPALLQQLNGPAPAAAPGIIRAPASPMQDIQQRRGEIGIQADLQGMQNDSVRLSIAQQQAALAQRDQALQEEKAARERAKYAATGGVDTTEAEKTAAFLATRVASGLKTLKIVGSAGDASLANRAAESLPFGIGNYFVGEDRQRTATAQLDVLDAALTLGTGAAYTKEQLEGYRQSYFPQPGDGPDVIADKRSRLNVLLEAAKVKAGAAAPQIDAALNAAGVDNQQEGANPVDVALTGKPKKEADGSISVLQSDGTTSVYPNEHAYQMSQDGTPQITVTDESAAPSPTAQARDSTLGTIDSIVRGAADTLTLGFADEIAAAGDTVFGSGTMRDNLRRQRGIDAIDEQVNPYARLSGQVIGGLALPAGSASGAAGLARIGALYGAGYGAGSVEGSIGDRLIGAGKGAVVGGVTGGTLGALGSRLAPDGGAIPPGSGSTAQDLMAAARRQQIDPIPADVGGPLTRRVTSAISQSPYGGGTIIRAGQRMVGQSEEARNRIAASVGNAVDPVVAGEAATAGAQSYIKTSGATGGRLYDRAAELAGDARIDPASARQVLDQNISELAQSPLGAPATLTNLRSKLDGDFTVSGLRNLRTQLRDEFAANGLRGSDAERRGMQAVDALTNDISAGLAAAGKPEAAAAYKAADDAWRERIDTIDNALKPIIGDGSISGEKVMRNIMTATRSDSARLRRFVDTLPRDDQNTLRATVISQLGKANAGAQDATGQAFSLNTFLTHYSAMTDQAKNVLFKGDTRSALDDLAKVASGAREAAAYANRSNTSGSLMTLINVTTGAGQYVTGRLLASPRVARALASPSTDKAQILKKLGNIAAREPALAPDLSRLTQAISNAPRAAAASDQENQ